VRLAAGTTAAVLVLAEVTGGLTANFEAAGAMAGVSARQLDRVSALQLATPDSAEVVVLSAGDQASGPWGNLLYAFGTGHPARSWQALALDPGPHSVIRVADRVIDIAPASDDGFAMSVYRDARRYPMHAGDRVSTRGLTIEVAAVQGGRPTRIRVTADRSLDDAAFVFAARGQGGKLMHLPLPPVGRGGWVR
jgi:hypothetical protein